MFHIDKNFGLFVGELTENKFHKHYALQISVAVNSKMTLIVKNEEKTSHNAFFLNSKIEHQLLSQFNQLTILINPLSSVGHQLHLNFEDVKFQSLSNELSNQLITILKRFESHEIAFDKLCELVAHVLHQYQCNCEQENHLEDDRIVKAIKFMDLNFEKVLSLEEVAAHCFLSPSRFLHLFKEKTNLSFRRYQLWNKLVKSLPHLKKHSITDTAYAFGFSDSSHYTRSFKESFGMTPKFLLQN